MQSESKFHSFCLRKSNWKCCLQNVSHFVPAPMSLSMPLMFHSLWSLHEVCWSPASIDPVLSIMRSFGMASFSSIDNHYSEFSLVSKMQEGCDNTTNPPKTVPNSNIIKYCWCIMSIHLLDPCETLHRVRQWYCRALCKVSHWSGKSESNVEKKIFNEIWVSDMHLHVW